jgi:hypothetical protein
MTEAMLSAGYDPVHLEPEFAAEARAQALLAVAAQRLEGFRLAQARFADFERSAALRRSASAE